MANRYQVSDHAGAALANVVLKDVGYLSEINIQYTIYKDKLRPEREKYT